MEGGGDADAADDEFIGRFEDLGLQGDTEGFEGEGPAPGVTADLHEGGIAIDGIEFIEVGMDMADGGGAGAEAREGVGPRAVAKEIRGENEAAGFGEG